MISIARSLNKPVKDRFIDNGAHTLYCRPYMLTARRLRIGLAVATFILLTPLATHATTFTIFDYGGTIGFGTADLKTTIVNVVSVLLGLLSLAAVVMIIVGGIRWMTSGGNEEQLELAKKTISSAIIGIVIVLLSWAIVTYVVGTTTNVVQ